MLRAFRAIFRTMFRIMFRTMFRAMFRVMFNMTPGLLSRQKKLSGVASSFLFLVLILPALILPENVYAANLLQIYELALDNDPEIRRAEAARNEALEAGAQSTARFLPSVFLGADSTSVSDETTAPDISVSPPVLTTSDSSFTTTSFNLTLTQPVYHGDAFVQRTQAKAIVSQAEVDFQSAQQYLMLRVAEQYFGVLAAQDNLTFARTEKKAIDRQLEQTKQRFNVGLIAITDVHEAQSRFDLAIANEIAAENRLANAHESLREISGKYVSELASISEKTPLLRPDPNSIDRWGEAALKQNLELLSTQYQVNIAKSNVDFSRSGHYPTIDLVGRYSDTDSLESNFLGRQSTSTSVSVQFNWSLYEGGATSSRTTAARHRLTQAQQNLESQRRATLRGARNAYLGVLAGISRVKALKQAVISQQSALDATKAGFDVGTRTTVDVLNARTLLYGSQRNYAQSRYDYILNSLRLKLAAGILNEDNLRQVNDWLQ